MSRTAPASWPGDRGHDCGVGAARPTGAGACGARHSWGGCGAGFGLTATLVKETVAQFSARGLTGVGTTWQTVVAVGLGALGIVLVR